VWKTTSERERSEEVKWKSGKRKAEELRQKELDEITQLSLSFDEQENLLRKEEEEYNNVLKSADVLLKEATKKLSAAMKANNDLEIQVAKGMLERSENCVEKGRKGLQTCQQKRNELSKKRSAATVKRKETCSPLSTSGTSVGSL